MHDISKIKIEDVEYREVIEEAKEKVCDRYNSGYTKKRKNAEEDEKNDIAFVFRVLSMATSFTFKPDDVEKPFVAMIVMEGSRTAIPDDFTDEQLELINKFVDKIDDPELKARLADIIWIRKRNFEQAKIAINCYLDSAEELLYENQYYAIDRLERVLRLTNSLGKGVKDRFGTTIKKIESFIEKIEQKNIFSILRLMKLLLEFNRGNAKKYSDLTENLAKRAESNRDWRRVRSCWETNAKWHAKLDNSDQEKMALIKAADSYVKEAEAATSKMVAASFYQQAIQAHRRIGNQQKKTKELHKVLLEVQKGIRNELSTFSTDLDISKLVEHARATVRNKGFRDALFSMCLLVEPLNVEQLRERTQEMANKHPMQFIISGKLLDEEGKTIAEYPDMLSGTPEEREEALFANMNREAQNNIQINIRGLINPARKQLLLDHQIRETDLHEFVQNNPLVPPGREHLFARGLYDGIKGDFISAVNILVTQLEHSMRYILNSHGIITSGLNDQRQQDDRGLTATLKVDELDKIFGEDIAFTLRSLLINKFGSNLRNKVAHGLMWYYSYYSADSIYFWAFVLRLICWPGIVNTYGTREQTVK
jgi:hypothetical protein